MATQTPQLQVEARLTHGGRCLELTRRDRRGRAVVTVYAVELPAPGRVELIKADETPYTTTRYGCSCPDWKYRGHETFDWCRHRRGLAQVGLLPPVPEPEREDHDPRRDDEGAG